MSDPLDNDAAIREILDEWRAEDAAREERANRRPMSWAEGGLVQVSVRLPVEDLEELQERAEQMGLGYTTLIRMIVREYLGREEAA